MTREIAKKIAWVILVFVLILLAILGSLLAYQKAYAGKIYRNVSISGIDLSGLTKKQAGVILQKKFQDVLNKEVTLKSNDKSIAIKYSDTGVEFNVGQMINDSYGVGRNPNFYRQIMKSASTIWKKENIGAVPIINRKKYDDLVNVIIPQLNTEAKDATLAIKDGEIIEEKEVVGQKTKTDELTDRLLVSIESGSNLINLEADVVRPKIAKQNFTSAKTYARSILQKQITLTYENFAFTPSKEGIGSWIAFANNNGQIAASLDDSQIKSYLTQVATNFEVQKVNRKINAVDGSVIVDGKAGKYLQKDEAINQIKSQTALGDQINVALSTKTVEPEEEKVFPAEGLVPGRYPGKYIDVDLTQQKLCLINGSNIEKCYIVSTGKWSTPTPIGTRTIDSKNPRAWSAKYGLWMPWWQSLGGGYGIHELPEWPSGYKEGEAHLGTPVSHGCIRLGVGSAKEVYDWTDTGTAVYIHK